MVSPRAVSINSNHGVNLIPDDDLSQAGAARISRRSAGAAVPGLGPGRRSQHPKHGFLPGDLGLPGLHLDDARRP